MEPMQIVLTVLALAGVWAVVELALVLRRTRDVVTSIDKVAREVDGTVQEMRPIVSKLDGVVDELQPALAQVEPLLRQTTVAMEALSSDLVEVNGVLRDISEVSSTASAATSAVNGIADAATEKVQQLIGRVGTSKRVELPAMPDAVPAEQAPRPESFDCGGAQYFTYDSPKEGIDG